MNFAKKMLIAGAAASSLSNYSHSQQEPDYSGYSEYYDRTYPLHNAIPPEGFLKTDMAFTIGNDNRGNLQTDTDFELCLFPKKLPVWCYVDPLETNVIYSNRIGLGLRFKAGKNLYLMPSMDFLPTVWTSEEEMRKNDYNYEGGDFLYNDGFLGATVHGTLLTDGKLSFDFSPSIRRYLETKTTELCCPVTAWLELPTAKNGNYESAHLGISRDMGTNALSDLYIRLSLVTKHGEEYRNNFFRGEKCSFEIGLGRKIYAAPNTETRKSNHSLMARLRIDIDGSDEKNRKRLKGYGQGNYLGDCQPLHLPDEEYREKPRKQPRQGKIFSRKTVKSTGR